jgi:hypothetical protein
MSKWAAMWAVGACASAGLAQVEGESAVIDLAGVQIKNATNQFRTSAPTTVDPAFLYEYEINGLVKGSGFVMGLLVPDPTPLKDVLEMFQPGSSAFLTGEVENPSGTHPVELINEHFNGSGTYSGINVTFEADIAAGIDASNVAWFEIKNVKISPASLVGSLSFVSGTATITRVVVCYADCDESGSLDLFDFLCFTNAFNGGEPYADCDGSGGLDLFDFLCFTNAFNAGCP